MQPADGRPGITIVCVIGLICSLIALGAGFGVYNFVSNVKLGAWWASIVAVIAFIIGLTASLRCVGSANKSSIYIAFIVFAVIACIILVVGIFVDSIAYGVIMSFSGCYRTNNYYLASCCSSRATSYPGVCFINGYQPSTYSPSYYFGNDCVCCTSTSSGALDYDYDGVSDCSEISGGKYTDLLAACFAFNILSFIFLVVGSSMGCCACSEIRRSAAQQVLYVSAAQPVNSQVPYGQPQYAAQPQYAQPQYAQPQYAQPQYAAPQYAQAQYVEAQPANSVTAPLKTV